MSQIGTGELDRRMRRTNVNLGAERTGITGSLGAPGVTPIGPQSANANLLAQFDQALGVAGQFANQVRSEIRYVRDEERRIAQGKATLDSQTDLAEDLANLSDKDLAYFAEIEASGGTIEDVADDIVRRRTEGMDPAYRERYEAFFKPRFVGAAVGRREDLEEAERGNLFRDFTDALAGSIAGGGNPVEEAKAILGDMRALFPDMDEADILAPLVSIGMEAAKGGDETTARTVIDLLGTHHQVDQQQIVRTLDDSVKQAGRQRVSDLADFVQSEIMAGRPVESVVKMIDKFEGDLPPLVVEKLRGALAAREAGRVDDQQRIHLNDTRLMVGTGLYPDGDPTLAAAQILADMARDPGDPMFIPATSGFELIDKLETNLKTNAYRVAVEDAMTRNDAMPLSSSYDTAIDQAFADRGIVDAIPTENGQALVRSIRDPAAFAYAADKVGRVTNSTRELIASGLAGDGEVAQESAKAYIALFKQNPTLAAQVVQNMSDPVAKLRARYLESRLDRTTAPWNDIDFLRIRPIDLDKDTLRQTVWTPDEDMPVRDSKIREMSREFIVEAVNDTEFKDTFAFGFGRELAPISAATKRAYAGILEEEFLFARSMIADDEKAMVRAKKNAASRFMAEYPPVIWDGEIMFTDGGPTVPPNFQDMVTLDLSENEGWTEEAIDRLVERYRPTWDAANQAWAFVDEEGGFYPDPDPNAVGGVMLLDLMTSEEFQKIEDWGNEQRARAERAERERKIKERMERRTFDGLDPTTIQSIP